MFRASDVLEGFGYRPGIISPAEESNLAREIAALPLEEFRFQSFLAKRRVMSFGRHYGFERAQTGLIPEFLLPLRARAASFGGTTSCTRLSPNMPLALQSGRIGTGLCFRRKAGTKWLRHALTAEPRPIYLMRGPARWEWEHSIPEVEQTRYSVTFRTLRTAAER